MPLPEFFLCLFVFVFGNVFDKFLFFFWLIFVIFYSFLSTSTDRRCFQVIVEPFVPLLFCHTCTYRALHIDIYVYIQAPGIVYRCLYVYMKVVLNGYISLSYIMLNSFLLLVTLSVANVEQYLYNFKFANNCIFFISI